MRFIGRTAEAVARRLHFWHSQVQQAYDVCLKKNPLGEVVLLDVFDFCEAHETTFVPNDPNGRTQAFLEGKRAVWLHIQGRLRLRPMEADEMARKIQEMNE